MERMRNSVRIEGKEELDAESRETCRAAETAVRDFLIRTGFPEAAERIKGFADSEKIFFFDSYVIESPFGGELERNESDGTFAQLFGDIGIGGRVLRRDGQDGVYSTAVHELLHLASHLGGPASFNTVETEGRTAVRIRTGFGVAVPPTQLADTEHFSHKSYFTVLNEGMTETLASMIDPSNWNKPHQYNLYRYLIQILLRAVVAERRKTDKAYGLKDAWSLFANDYFNNTFAFAKEVDATLGKGTVRALSHLPVGLEQTPEDGADDATVELHAKALAGMNELFSKLCASAGIAFDPDHLAELREGRHGGSQLANLKRMQDETMRAAFSAPAMARAA